MGTKDNNTVHMSQDITLSIHLPHANGLNNESRNDENEWMNDWSKT